MLLDEPWNTLGIWFNVLLYGCDKTAANLFLTHMFFVSSLTGFWQPLIGELKVVEWLFLTWTSWQLQGCLNICLCGWCSDGSGLTIITSALFMSLEIYLCNSPVQSVVQCWVIAHQNFGTGAVIGVFCCGCCCFFLVFSHPSQTGMN